MIKITILYIFTTLLIFVKSDGNNHSESGLKRHVSTSDVVVVKFKSNNTWIRWDNRHSDIVEDAQFKKLA